jgi:hypothetical protein
MADECSLLIRESSNSFFPLCLILLAFLSLLVDLLFG